MPGPAGPLRIREADDADQAAIADVHHQAFAAEESSQVAGLSTDLLGEHAPPPVLTLVAESGQLLVGHIAFSPLWDTRDERWRAYLLAPLGVVPQWQRCGVGSELVNAGMQRLRDDGVHRLFVYGDPDYYGRFGFRAAGPDDYPAPYPLQFPHGWLSIALNPWSDPAPRTTLQCVSALRNPELW